MADDNISDDNVDEGGSDLGAFVPEAFKGEDGAFDTEGFRAKYDELAAFKSTYDESKAELPESPEGYAFALAEDHEWPEGFDPAKMKTTDEEGNEVEFDPSKLLASDDPDIPTVQALLHEIGAPASVMGKIAGIMVNRELRSVIQAEANAAAEKKALGPDGQARIDTVTRVLKSRMEPSQAKALLDGITSADALKGFEKIIKAGNVKPAPSEEKDFSAMSPMERVMYGNKQRSKSA